MRVARPQLDAGYRNAITVMVDTLLLGLLGFYQSLAESGSYFEFTCTSMNIPGQRHKAAA